MLLRAHLINTDMSQDPLPDDSGDDSHSAQFRFMDLPPEVRDNVYENLLCPRGDRKEHREYKFIRDYDLEPAILRTCKLVCEEGSRILYAKNDTFLIRMDEFAYREFKDQDWPVADLPIARLEGGEAEGMSVLTMEIEQHVTTPSKSKRTNKSRKCKKAPQKQFLFIGLLLAIPKVCRFLTSCYSVGDLQLEVHMEGPVARSPERWQEILTYCLQYFQEARGLGNAIIFTEPEHSDEAAKIADLMTTQLDTVEKALRIARAYESRVSEQMKMERWDDARETLQNALEYFDLLQGNMRPVYLMSSVRAGIKNQCPLEDKMIDMQWKYISCCLEVGRTGDVRYQVHDMFPRYESMQTPAQREAYQRRLGDAHCAIGKAYEIDGVLNSAVYSYLQAVRSTPGHVEADEAIDRLEERVKSSSSPEGVRAKLNIDVVLGKFRHQGMGRDPLSQAEAKAVTRGFTATVNQIAYLLHNDRLLKVSRIQTLPSTETLF